MTPAISVRNLSKTYASGHQALKSVNLDISRGEIFALLRPNGAGKTTLIGTSCTLGNPADGEILVDELDIATHWRTVRSRLGLVPQDLSIEMFEPVQATVAVSRGLFGK